ncbi:MAG: molybdate ABC transporter substrate-binding protein [Magnetococcales bacterium]|nr:molybdate ABC transporter substrate-binding protein [Magnetococcales bacterium]
MARSREGLLVVRPILLATLLWGSLFPIALRAETVSVAVTASFAKPFRELAAAFERRTRHGVEISAGSTGKLFAQIVHGAPYHLFVAADAVRPRELEEKGLVTARGVTTLGFGRLLLWSPDPALLTDGGEPYLRRRSGEKLALANPESAPFGQAAQEAMRHLRVWDSLQPRLVFGENVGQVMAFVTSGNAEAGFIAKSQYFDPAIRDTGSFWEVPDSWHTPLPQEAVLLLAGERLQAAHELVAYLRSPPAQAEMRRWGYDPP